MGQRPLRRGCVARPCCVPNPHRTAAGSEIRRRPRTYFVLNVLGCHWVVLIVSSSSSSSLEDAARPRDVLLLDSMRPGTGGSLTQIHDAVIPSAKSLIQVLGTYRFGCLSCAQQEGGANDCGIHALRNLETLRLHGDRIDWTRPESILIQQYQRDEGIINAALSVRCREILFAFVESEAARRREVSGDNHPPRLGHLPLYILTQGIAGPPVAQRRARTLSPPPSAAGAGAEETNENHKRSRRPES